MKKIIALIMAGMMMFGMVACGDTEVKETQADTTVITEDTTIETQLETFVASPEITIETELAEEVTTEIVETVVVDTEAETTSI